MNTTIASGTQPTWDPNVTLKLSQQPAAVNARDHQIAAWDKMTAHFTDAKKQAGLIVVPTGGGKTVLAAHWLLEHHIREGGRVLWFAHRHSLLRQAFATFTRLHNVAYPKKSLALIAISSDDARWSMVRPDHDVVFSSMQTAVREGNAGFLHEFHTSSDKGLFVVVDEAHHAPAPGYARLLRKLKEFGCKLVGLTATPVRQSDEDQRRLAALFDQTILYQVTRRQLTEKGILAAPAFETVKTQVNLEKDFTPEDYKHLERFGEISKNVLHRLAENASRNGLIVDHYVGKKETYGPTIVFAADTLHASTLAEEFRKRGVDADHVDYSRKDAQQIIERYQKEKKPDVLVNVEMLTEGFDAPHTRTVFIARPTRSEGLLAQMVGRALRGKQSNGNDIAYLVTFLDTWEQFDVLDPKYALGDAEDSDPATVPVGDVQTIVIPPELVREAYRLVQSNTKGQLIGVFQCLPYSWYSWVESFEDDEQRRTIMVFNNQVDGFKALLDTYADVTTIPAEISEDLARDLVRKYFGETPDPLPRWLDLKALLDAKRKECEIHNYTFEEKNQFDPSTIANAIVAKNLTTKDEQAYLQNVWSEKPACRSVYQQDFQAFFEDVSREKIILLSPAKPQIAPEIEKIVPTHPPRAWPHGEAGYSLVAIRDAVLTVPKHFPGNPPLLGDIRWSKRANPSLWGFFRCSDKTISINCALNSPDIPRFIVEFLMFHEMLHADMPSAGHNRDFRARERGFTPSAEAIEDAAAKGIKRSTSSPSDFWRVRTDMYLDTFDRYYVHKKPGTLMGL